MKNKKMSRLSQFMLSIKIASSWMLKGVYFENIQKRERCARMIREAYLLMNMPGDGLKSLKNLDLTLVSDEDIDRIILWLAQMKKEYDYACARNGGKDIFKSIIEIQN